MQAYFALLKAYCAINILLLPKSFKNGGYMLSPIALLISCFFEGTCAIKLSQCGTAIKSASYTDIVYKALGPKIHSVFQVVIAFVQFQFTISQLAFVIQAISSSITHERNKEINTAEILVSLGVLFIFTPFTFVRSIEKFRFGFIFGVLMILVAVITISIYCFKDIGDRKWEPPTDQGYYSINNETYWNMIGFSFFMFEGIGAVMPVMNACNDRSKEIFPYLVAACLGTLVTIYILFSELCYYNFGDQLTESIVMQEMPAQDTTIKIVKVLFCLNILFSYTLTIYPTNCIIDQIINSKFQLVENITRVTVLFIGILMAVFFYEKLDKILALSGTILGTTVVLLIPSLCHYQIISKDYQESKVPRYTDVFIIIYSLVVMILCSYQVISGW